ncbi:MAG: hypothetical protein MJA28_01600 [Gammaproteobacteria bacterium]|nr:hypothetical protein [Gammaproteobacteria bacterium]
MPKYNQSGKNWQYSNECKVKAIQLGLIEGVQIQEVASMLNIHPFRLSRKKLKQELDLLKKWPRVLAEKHQQDIDSSRGSDENSVSNPGVNGSEYPAALTAPGSIENRTIERSDENEGRHGKPQIWKALLK